MGPIHPFVVAIVAASSLAAAAPPALSPQPLASGLVSPTEIAHANDGSGRLFVLEQVGRVRVIRNGVLLASPFLDITAKVKSGGEQGLLGIAFHPSYITNGRFFVYYTRPLAGDAQGSEIVIERYTRSAIDADAADASSGQLVLQFGHPTYNNHNGGKLAFGSDGYLYVGVGDGGGGGDPFRASQSLIDLRGKILRLEVDGDVHTIPRDNPFKSPALPQIWDFGLRNPWKFSFDRATGELLVGDVGQDVWEEIDVEPPRKGGRNYGWSVYEATHCYAASSCTLPGHVPPVFEYAHGADGNSITGGYRYRGTSLPALVGYYVYGDFGSGRIWASAPQSGTWTPTQVATVSNLSTLGEDEYGELYAANYSLGTIVRLTPAAVPPQAGSDEPRYRLYNAGTFEHLYTTDANEYAVLPACCGWQPEGITHRVLAGPGSVGGVPAVPYYRLYNPSSHQHHWTIDANEYNVLSTLGWQQEGIDGYILPTIASGAVPLYRLYLDVHGGLHHWTTDANERHVLTTSNGWIDEGIAGYVLPAP